jgi:hypothetical protein
MISQLPSIAGISAAAPLSRAQGAVRESDERRIGSAVAALGRSLLLILAVAAAPADAERILKSAQTQADKDRILSEQALEDDLRPGDVVSTDRGFLEFRGLNGDGKAIFKPAPHPLGRATGGDRVR